MMCIRQFYALPPVGRALLCAASATRKSPPRLELEHHVAEPARGREFQEELTTTNRVQDLGTNRVEDFLTARPVRFGNFAETDRDRIVGLYCPSADPVATAPAFQVGPEAGRVAHLPAQHGHLSQPFCDEILPVDPNELHGIPPAWNMSSVLKYHHLPIVQFQPKVVLLTFDHERHFLYVVLRLRQVRLGSVQDTFFESGVT